MQEANKLKIALIGYGKMGKVIEGIAISRGHEIVLKITSDNSDDTIAELAQADVAIEFTNPDAAVANIKKCIDANVPVAIGTTGWYDDIADVEAYVATNNGCILPATNFSIGVNIFFKINKQLAALMNKHSQYQPSITEIHHTQKLDAPSGTAITLAEGIIENMDEKNSWVKEMDSNVNELPIKSLRIDSVPGTHDVIYDSEVDKITISHEAKNRRGFALGAVLAAEFIANKQGVFSMQDVI